MMSNSTQPTLAALQEENRRLRAEVDRVSRERIEYLQNVAHQLVAPLNAIKWHIENLTQGRLSVDRIKKVLQSVYSQATVAVHLAKNFALMSNLEADHSLSALREPLQPVNLSLLLINLANDFQPQGWDKEVQIVVQDHPLKSAPPVLVIRPLVSQVFSNIIENAVKYARGTSMIRIEGEHDSVNDVVTVRITNEGIPLRPADVDRVFDRGYRTQEAKSLYPAGTGFGLYIAKKIVELHEGKIQATPSPGGAVAFSVSLPVKALEGRARQRDPKDRSSR
jgi:signal transduction histidine kinase